MHCSMKEESVIVLVINMENHWLTNRFSYDLPDLAFHFFSYKGTCMHNKSTSMINESTCQGRLAV